MNEDNYVYRVVTEDGQPAWEGRGSDPFTQVGSARRRKSKLNNEAANGVWDNGTRYKVQRSKVEWEDFE